MANIHSKTSDTILDWIAEYGCRYDIPQIVEAVTHLYSKNGRPSINGPKRHLALGLGIAAVLQMIAAPDFEDSVENILEMYDEVVPESLPRDFHSPYFCLRIEIIIQAILKCEKDPEKFMEMLDHWIPHEDKKKGLTKEQLLYRATRANLLDVMQSKEKRGTSSDVHKRAKEFKDGHTVDNFFKSMRNYMAKVKEVHGIGETYLDYVEREIYAKGIALWPLPAGSKPATATAKASGAAAAAASPAGKKKAAATESAPEPAPADDSATIQGLRSTRSALNKRGRDPLPETLAVAEEAQAAAVPATRSPKTAKRAISMSDDEAQPAAASQDMDVDADLMPSPVSSKRKARGKAEVVTREKSADREEKYTAQDIDEVDESAPPALPDVSAPSKRAKLGAAASPKHVRAEAPRAGQRLKWSDDEVLALIEGVKQFHAGKQSRMDWKSIRDKFEIFQQTGRTGVDLKDKWRNLEKSGLVPRLDEL